MADQPRYEPYEVGAMFADSLAMRKPVAGTVPRAHPLRQAYRQRPGRGTFLLQGAEGTRSTGQEAAPNQSAGQPRADGPGPSIPAGEDGGYPFLITRAVLERGRQRFEIFCSPCHGRDGYGRGIIVQRGLRTPPSFHSDRLRAAPPEHFYSVITDGYGAMYSYASRVEPADRWAIAAYIQALQTSQHVPAALLPDTLSHLPTQESE